MKRLFAPTLIIAALSLGACGSDGDVSTADAADTTAAETADATSPTTAETETETASGKDGPVDRVTRLWIKPNLVDCVGEAPQKCMQVAEAEGVRQRALLGVRDEVAEVQGEGSVRQESQYLFGDGRHEVRHGGDRALCLGKDLSDTRHTS